MEEKEMHIKKGDAYLEEDQYMEAIFEYESAAQLTYNDRELAEIYVKIGSCYWEFCEYTEIGFDDAGVYFELAYEQDPENEDAVRGLGMEYLHWKDEVACTYFEKLIDMDKACVGDREELFLCYERLGRFEDAEKVLDGSAGPGWWHGKYYMDIRRYEKTLKLFETVIDRRSEEDAFIPYDVHYLMGKCYEHLREFKKAEETYLYGLQQHKSEGEFVQKQFYHALFLFSIRTCNYDFRKIRNYLKKIAKSWIIPAVIEYEIDYVEALHHGKKPDKKKLTGIIKKTRYMYEQDHNRLYPYALLAVGDLCRFYANDFAQARQFFDMAVGCMKQYSMSICEEDLLIRIYLGHMEMAHKENHPEQTSQYASLLMEQVRKIYPTREALAHFVQDDMYRDIIYRYYCCLEDKEKADSYYDSLWDTPFVIGKYMSRYLK